ncbi:putative LPXTG cell wall anchor domain protein [Actinacidiphila cocklensis]|uniref:LPXTG cell wall anchor domain protein n=2 Tax=Actinacidiphila cocklensis TaxID=887465 RepID=A0A9W4DT41_9ACTN|nr:putative LPXTG cell wall anchor domain protein [Actinacidiphila cocklensis]
MYRRALRASAVALVMSGAALALAPSALAIDDTRQMTLSVDAPTEIGFAGGPVEFTETFGNTGTTFVPEYLHFAAETGSGVSADSMTLDYLAANGKWEPLDLTYNANYGEFYGRTTETFSVAPGTTQTVHLRIGMPMGTPHHGDTNGGTDHITLNSSLIPEGELIADVDDTHTIKVTPPAHSFVEVPLYASPGGAPIEFGAKLTNTTKSKYTNLSYVLFTDKYTSVQVLKGDKWTTVPAVTNPDADYFAQGFYLAGPNSTVAPDSSSTTRVRVAWRADAPVARARLEGCVIVNERPGTPAFDGTTFCDDSTWLNVTNALDPTPTPTATASAPATPTATATTTPPGTGPRRAARRDRRRQLGDHRRPRGRRAPAGRRRHPGLGPAASSQQPLTLP